MATVTIKMPEEFMNQLSELDSRLEDVITKSLEDGAEIAEKQARANLKAAIGSGTKLPSRSTGRLLNALGTSPVKPSELGGYDIRVGFAEPRGDDYDELKSSRFRANPIRADASYNYFSKRQKRAAGVRVRNYSFYVTTNEMIANVLEYGKKGQAAKPFMKPAEDATKAKVKAKMEETFKAEAEKIFK